MKENKISILGCGNLGLSIVKGLLDKKDFPAKNIVVTKRNVKSIEFLKEQGIEVTSENKKAVSQSEIILVAVKPYDVRAVLEEIKDQLVPGKHMLISVATGVSIKEIKEVVKAGIPVFRAMPNTAADVKESITCICYQDASPADIEIVKYFFDLIGNTITIKEELMESATVLGACGIAFVLRFMRAMVQGGIQIGFDSQTASAIVNQTVKGAAQLLIERKQHAEFEIDKVTTPKGCTIVGLNEMEHNGFSSSLIRGIVASYEKIEK
jgi:pyrroline-5-carboxylate reductase